MGRLFEGAAKTDPTIRLLASKLAAKIPKLAERLAEGQAYESVGPGGKAAGHLKGQEFVTRSQKLADGSLIQHTPAAVKSIRKILERQGYDGALISDYLQLLERVPENTRIPLAGDLEVIKWSIERIEPTLNGPQLSPLIPLKTAYEFLALHLNSAVYEEVPALSAARSALSGGDIDPVHLLIERLQASTPQPFHGIAFEGNSPWAKVQVRLFGLLAFRIHFKTLSVGGSQFVYTHDLASHTEHIADSSVSETGS